MIYILAGHHNKDSGAVSGNYKEAELTKELRNLIQSHLNVKVDNDDWTLQQTIDNIKSNLSSNDVVVDIHFNAGHPSATGVEVLVGDDASDKSKSLADKVSKSISEILQIKNRGVKKESESARGRLAIMRVKCPVILIEVCFISNSEDMRKYEQHKDSVAKGIVKVLSN